MSVKPICGIYLIENKKTGQKYIGQSINIHRRWRKHCTTKQFNNSYIDKSIRKYGESNFKLIILEELPRNQDLLNEREIYWIEKYNTFKDKSHYNLTAGGKSLFGKNHPMYGKHHSEKTKKRLSEKNKGTKLSDKAIKMLHNRKGKNHPMHNKSFSDSVKINMSKGHNKTGYYRVTKQKDARLKQGFTYQYHYTDENNVHKAISSISLEKLKEKVIQKGLTWLKLEEQV